MSHQGHKEPWFQVYCFAHVLIATCQYYGRGGIVQLSDVLIQP